jgi:uncharacterized protein YjeT (DUF2065 family)
MKWFLYLISGIWIAYGAWQILYTEQSRQMARDLFKASYTKVLGLVAALVGLLLLLSTTHTLNPPVMIFLGILIMAKGAFLFFNPGNLYARLYQWYVDSNSDQTYRLYGIILLILGTVVLSWIK